MFKNKRVLLLVVDAVIVCASMYLALFFRFEGRIASTHMATFLRMLPFIILVRLVIFWLFGLYKGMWQYAGIKDLSSIVKAITLGSVILAASILFLRLPYSRAVLAIDWLLNLALIGGARFTIRMWREWYFERKRGIIKRILIAGAGDAGEMTLREINNHPESGYQPIGFIDDNRHKQGLSIHGVEVLGRRNDILRVVKERDIEEIIIAMPSASGKIIRNIVSICEEAGVRCKTIPGLNELIRGKVSINKFRDIKSEDLLQREAVKIDLQEIPSYIKGKRVLITGAGGSIGSELCRQVCRFAPREIIALDHNENSLFYLEYELNGNVCRDTESVPVKTVVGDIKDKEKMRSTFNRFHPEIIFHAAAHKHVPLMEREPEETVKNNILGTDNLANLADEHKVEKFINISTDKAVNPTSVMGSSKKVAEMIVQAKDNSGTCFVSVRFGNVLGSEGSVVPLFQRQIAEGGPVTVTHKEATRYFMTIPEAVQLIVQAGAMGKGGEVFVLDMGEPVKILDLARDLIVLSGLEPDEDIFIEFIGLRSGEKLHEETLTAEEGIKATRHKQIFITMPNQIDKEKLEKDIRILGELAVRNDKQGIIEKLKEMVPGYQPKSA